MEKIVKQGLLYDFYGELLTDHQKEVYEDLVYDNYSVSEIAARYSISRQGASDLIKRIDGILNGYEEKLHLVERFENIREKIESNPKLTSDEKKDILKDL